MVPVSRAISTSALRGSTPPSSRHRWLWVGVRLGVAALLLYVAGRQVSWDALLRHLGGADLALVGVATLYALAAVALRAWRLALLLAVSESAGTYGDALRATLMAASARLVLPGKLGDLLRAFWLPDVSRSAALGAVALDVTLEASAALLLAVPGLAIWLGPLAGAAAVLAAVALVLAARRPGPLLRSLARLPGLGLLRGRSVASEEALRRLGLGRFCAAFAVGGAALGLRVGVLYVLLVALGVSVPALALIGLPLVVLVEGVPVTVGGLGVREWVGLALLVPLGVGAAPALGALLGLFALSTLVPGLAGLFGRWAPRPPRTARDGAPR